jgi:hypothetical protein
MLAVSVVIHVDDQRLIFFTLSFMDRIIVHTGIPHLWHERLGHAHGHHAQVSGAEVDIVLAGRSFLTRMCTHGPLQATTPR